MKRALPSAIVPRIDRSAGIAYHRQIFQSYRAAILDGQLRPGQRLPSTRMLARKLGISRLPVLDAFERLLQEGYVVGRVGSGTYVSAAGFDRAETVDRAVDVGPFRVSAPALDQFPHHIWRRLVARHARNMPIDMMAYGDPLGHLPLRMAIVEYLRSTRGVSCDESQVLITSGSQMGLQLCALALLGRADSVGVEDPGYFGARRALGIGGATVRPVPVDTEGLLVRALGSGRGRCPRVVYVTPAHQYPLGVPMAQSRRFELLEWVRCNEAWIIEDDYDSEYRYVDPPLGSLQGMDGGTRVIYMGTFSKAVFPSLRVGYIVVPRSLVKTFVDYRESLDLFSSTLYQAVLADFLREGHFVSHLRRMREVYKSRRDALVDALARRLDNMLSIVNADAGLHLTALLPQGIDDRRIARAVGERGISALPLSACYAGKETRAGLVLGFGCADETQLDRAVEVLAHVIESKCVGQKWSC